MSVWMQVTFSLFLSVDRQSFLSLSSSDSFTFKPLRPLEHCLLCLLWVFYAFLQLFYQVCDRKACLHVIWISPFCTHTKHNKCLLTQISLLVQLMMLACGDSISACLRISVTCAACHNFTIPVHPVVVTSFTKLTDILDFILSLLLLKIMTYWKVIEKYHCGHKFGSFYKHYKLNINFHT